MPDHLGRSPLRPAPELISLLLLTLVSAHAHAAVSPVRTVPELKERIENAQAGERIELAAGTTFDLSHDAPLVISKPLTLAAPADANLRPRIYSGGKPLPLIEVRAANVSIEGLKIEGIETESRKDEITELNRRGIRGVYQFPITRGISVYASGFTLRNAEVSGFSHAAVHLENATSALIEKNSIHHNQRWGLGYGVVLSLLSTAEIRDNQFDFNRHSVAGSGHSGQSYEAHHNVFGPTHLASPLDMHGGADRGDGTRIAGRRVDIHDNLILSGDVNVFVHRGIAEEAVVIRDNRIPNLTSEAKAIGWYNVTRSEMPVGRYLFVNNRLAGSEP